MAEASELAGRYFDAWQAHDEHALAEILAEDVTFRGPLGTAHGQTDCIAGGGGDAGIVIAIQARREHTVDRIPARVAGAVVAVPPPGQPSAR